MKQGCFKKAAFQCLFKIYTLSEPRNPLAA